MLLTYFHISSKGPWEVEEKMYNGNQQLTATIEDTMSTALQKITEQHAISIAQQNITNTQLEHRQSQEIVHQ